MAPLGVIEGFFGRPWGRSRLNPTRPSHCLPRPMPGSTGPPNSKQPPELNSTRKTGPASSSVRIDTRGQLPVLVLNDHCALLMFIIPLCRIGHIESRGDLFDGAAAAHDSRLATPGPNDVP